MRLRHSSCFVLVPLVAVAGMGWHSNAADARADLGRPRHTSTANRVHAHLLDDVPQTSSPGTQAINTLPVAIDGAKTPDKISDQLAYRHFIAAVALSPMASVDEIDRRNDFLSLTDLLPDDISRFVTKIGHVKDQLDTFERTRRSEVVSLETLAQVNGQQASLLDEVTADVLQSLTEDGRTKFERFIRERVKRRIVVYGDSSQLDR